jgi:hypothetical protein
MNRQEANEYRGNAMTSLGKAHVLISTLVSRLSFLVGDPVELRKSERTAFMLKLSGKPTKLFTALLPTVAILLLLLSTSVCKAQPTISSITPNTWVAGQTVTVTITGSGFLSGDCANNEDCTNADSVGTNSLGGAQIYASGNITGSGDSAAQITFTVTVGANAPTGIACVMVYPYWSAYAEISRVKVRQANSADAESKISKAMVQQADSATLCPSDTALGLYAQAPVQIEGASKNVGEPCGVSGCAGVGADNSINVTSGNVFEEVTDYETAGQNKLSYTRYYNSLAIGSAIYNSNTGTDYYLGTEYAGSTFLGSNWRSNYDRILNIVYVVGSSDPVLVIAERPDGKQINFNNAGGSWTTDSDVDYILTQSGTTLRAFSRASRCVTDTRKRWDMIAIMNWRA